MYRARDLEGVKIRKKWKFLQNSWQFLAIFIFLHEEQLLEYKCG